MRRCAVLCWLALSSACALRPAAAQHLDIAYYDVDRLYDTIASPFYNDTDYTPEGRCIGTPNATVAKSTIRPPSSIRWRCRSSRSTAWRTRRSYATSYGAAMAIMPISIARSTGSTDWISRCSITATVAFPTLHGNRQQLSLHRRFAARTSRQIVRYARIVALPQRPDSPYAFGSAAQGTPERQAVDSGSLQSLGNFRTRIPRRHSPCRKSRSGATSSGVADGRCATELPSTQHGASRVATSSSDAGCSTLPTANRCRPTNTPAIGAATDRGYRFSSVSPARKSI